MNRYQSAFAAATACLRDSGLPFAVIGGVAVSARTEPRFTQDVDFSVATASDEAAQALGFQFLQRGFEQHAVLENARTGRMATLRLHHEHIIVDLLLDASGIESEVAESATNIDLPGVGSCPVATIAALIALKALARINRERSDDEADLSRLAANATPADWVIARALVAAIAERGYGDRDELVGVLTRFQVPSLS